MTPADLAGSLGVEAFTGARLAVANRVIESATDDIEQALRRYILTRKLTVYSADVPSGVPIWLPWGPAADATVTFNGASYTDFTVRRKFTYVDFLTTEDAGDFIISYTAELSPNPGHNRNGGPSLGHLLLGESHPSGSRVDSRGDS